MGKASSNKKVARAAKAGGGRARAAGERNVVFPAALALVVVLGTLLVVYARDQRVATALERPLIGDHWHAAVGFYVCDSFGPGLAEFSSPGGLHTHGTDSILHIEPGSSAGAGENATLVNTLEYAVDALGGDVLDDDQLGIPGDQTYTEGDDSCPEGDGEPIVQVAIWNDVAAAGDGDPPDRIVTRDFDRIRFRRDGQVFAVAFAPEGADLPAPPNVTDLASTNGAPEEPAPQDGSDDGATTTTPGETTDTTAGGETTDTTAPGETTDTTAGGDADDEGTTPTTAADDSSATTEPES